MEYLMMWMDIETYTNKHVVLFACFYASTFNIPQWTRTVSGMNGFILVGGTHQRWFINVQQHSHFWYKYFRETFLSPQQMVAEFWITDSLLEFVFGGILVLGVTPSWPIL